MLADIADEVEEGEVFHPVIVVDHLGGIGCVGVKVKKFAELTLDGLLVVAEGLFAQEFALLALHRGVAYHASRAAHEGDRLVARTLEVLEHHHAYEMAYME